MDMGVVLIIFLRAFFQKTKSIYLYIFSRKGNVNKTSDFSSQYQFNKQKEELFNKIKPIFNSEKYLKVHVDVKDSGMDPLDHYIKYGVYEHRLQRANLLDIDLYPDSAFESEWDLLIHHGDILNYENLNIKFGVDNKFDISIGIVIYNNDFHEIERLIKSINLQKNCNINSIFIFDCSDKNINFLYEDINNIADFEVFWYSEGGNIGFGRAHNFLMSKVFAVSSNVYLGLNPDGFLFPGSVSNSLKFLLDDTGIVDFLTEPLSHPKYYHPVTGETSWSSGVAFLIPDFIFKITGGFSDDIHLYAEDVDLSFRIRMAGYKCRTATNALFFHDVYHRDYNINIARELDMLLGNWCFLKRWGQIDRAAQVEARLVTLGESVPKVDLKVFDLSNYPSILSDIERSRYGSSRPFPES